MTNWKDVISNIIKTFGSSYAIVKGQGWEKCVYLFGKVYLFGNKEIIGEIYECPLLINQRKIPDVREIRCLVGNDDEQIREYYRDYVVPQIVGNYYYEVTELSPTSLSYEGITDFTACTATDVIKWHLKREKLDIPDDVEFILEKIEEWGFEAYIVGGCVRDRLRGVDPDDWDICTNAKVLDIMDIFSDYKVIPTGVQHGTVTLVLNGEQYEITTYRIDGKYTDGRHPDTVTFAQSLEEDLSRRDFTINAMAYNPNEGIIDLFGGREDLKNGTIRCVGKASDRFSEDFLRMFRALRFAISFGFNIDDEIFEAIKDYKDKINILAGERIFTEVEKAIMRANENSELILFDMLYELTAGYVYGIKAKINDNLDMISAFKVENYKGLREAPCDFTIRMLLFWGSYSNHLQEKLKFSNIIDKNLSSTWDIFIRIKQIKWLNMKTFRHFIQEYDFNTVKTAVDLWRYMLYYRSGTNREELKLTYKAYSDTLTYISMHNLPCKVLDLDVNGDDIIENFDIKGADIKTILNFALEEVISEKVPNEKAKLLDYIKYSDVLEEMKR